METEVWYEDSLIHILAGPEGFAWALDYYMLREHTMKGWYDVIVYFPQVFPNRGEQKWILKRLLSVNITKDPTTNLRHGAESVSPMRPRISRERKRS